MDWIKRFIFPCLIAVTIPTIACAAPFDDFVGALSKDCPNANQLTMKKAFIELNKETTCSGAFTELLLKECPANNCDQMLEKFKQAKVGRQGAVIGK